MGLDMYLFSLPKIEGMDYDEVHKANAHLEKHEAAQDEIYERIKPHVKYHEAEGDIWKTLYDELTYWRKANQIHNWFVENTNNGIDEPCFISQVSKDQLHELYKRCLEVLKRKDPPRDILPTKPGCFFGDTGYDSFYYREIEETKCILEALLKSFNFKTHYLIYQCSW